MQAPASDTCHHFKIQPVKMSFSLSFSLTDLKDLNTFLQSRSYVVG